MVAFATGEGGEEDGPVLVGHAAIRRDTPSGGMWASSKGGVPFSLCIRRSFGSRGIGWSSSPSSSSSLEASRSLVGEERVWT